MTEEISLHEKCKIAVWMEQFQCAEVVQLKFKKEFTKNFPELDFIKKIHHLFMTTGSVLDYSEYKNKEKHNNNEKVFAFLFFNVRITAST